MEMKTRIEMIAFDIENLDGELRAQAVKHLEESLGVLKLGSFLQFEKPDIKPDIKPDFKPETLELKQEELAETTAPQHGPSYPNLYNGLVPTCSECPQTFPTLGLLDAHMKKLHTETYRVNVSKSKAVIARKSKAFVSSSSPNPEKLEKEKLTSEKKVIQELTSEKMEKEELTSEKKEDITTKKVEKEVLVSKKIEKEELVKKKLKKKELVTKKLQEKKGIQIPEKQNEDNKKTFPCPDCEKSFANRNSLGKHKVSHTDRYKCQTCGKGFSQNRDIENHHKNQSSCNLPTSGESTNIRGA